MILIFRSRGDPKAPSVTMFGIFIGYMQFIWLCIVSFYFSSTIGGSLLKTLTFVVAFVSTVAASRALSIWWCRWMERKTDITIIEYDSASLRQKSPRDSAIITRLIAAFPGTIVEFVSLGEPILRDPTIGVPWGRFVHHLIPCKRLVVLGNCILISVPLWLFFVMFVGNRWLGQALFFGVLGVVVTIHSIFSSLDLFGRGGYLV